MPAVCGAGASLIFRWCRGGWSSPSKCARRCCATGRKSSRWNCPSRCNSTICARWRGCRRSPSSFIRTTKRRTAPSISRWSPPIRSSKPSAAALEIGAEVVFADPDSGERPHLKDAYPDPYAIRHIGLDEIRGSLPRVSAAALRRDRAARRWHRLEAAGLRSAGARAGGGVAESAGPACWIPWRSRRRNPCRGCGARACGCSIRIPSASPRSPSNIRICNTATSSSANC